MMRFFAATAAALCITLPAAASSVGTLTADYTGVSHGLTVLKLSGSLTLTPTGYAAHVTFHTAGLVGMMVHSDNDSQVQGEFKGGTAAPIVFAGTGHLRGTNRLTRIEYVDGNPVIRALSPPVEQERTPVPVAETAHTIDTLSALALLIRQVGQTGTCAGTVTTYDGRRLATQTAHSLGEETLPQTDHSIFAGRALHCDLEGRQLGGFVRDENEDALKKPRHGAAWLANMVPGAPPVPVKVIFENKILGEVTLYLTSVTGGPGAAVAQCCATGATLR
jgi:hypothetical protein